MVRSPAGTPITPGASPAATPSMLTAATTPAVSICSWPGSFASTRRSRSAPPRCTTSAASAGRYPSRSARTRCGPGETHSRPPRCSDSAPGARTRASSGCTSTTTDPSRPIRNATTAAAASHPSHFTLAFVARTRAPACGTPGAGGTSISSSSSPPSPGDTAASAPAGAMVTLPARCSTESRSSVREASLTRTCASPTLSTSSRRRSRSASSGPPLKRTDAHRLGRLSRADGDVATHVAVAVARADHGVVSGLELDVAPGEGAEGADARYRNLGEAVGEQREVHRLVEFRQQRAEARDLAAQHLTRRRLILRRLQEREGGAAHLGRRQTVRAIDERLERSEEHTSELQSL